MPGLSRPCGSARLTSGHCGRRRRHRHLRDGGRALQPRGGLPRAHRPEWSRIMTRLVRAELAKLRTIRLFYGVAAAMAAFGVLTVVANVTSAGQQGSPPLSADDLPALVGAPATMLAGAALLLGILGIAGEFRHHTITQTFLATPDRGRVVAAKLAAYALAGIAVAALTLAVTTVVSLSWLSAKGVAVSVLDGELGRALAGTLLAAGLCGLVGVGVGALVRNQVAALVGVLVWAVVVEGLLLSLLN